MPEQHESTVRLDHLARFSELTDAEVAKIAAAGTYVTVPADWALMGEGTSADKAYLLLSGTVSVRQHGEEIAQLGAGDIFGEVAIVAHRLRTATVVSLSRLECLHFTSETLVRLEEEIPAFKAALEASVAERTGSDAGS